MIIIDKYVREYKNNKGKLEDSEFSVFRTEDDKLMSSLDPVCPPFKRYDSLWDRNDLIKVMKADRGFVLEDDLVK
ncbi:hypothetical protein RclHR1_04030003 [Rhizophagus clarus]|nr:hypothetical protein RclHR1_04030003 [Rhizophagus clarus]